MNEVQAKIEYPLDSRPDNGHVKDIAPGIRWLRLPLPMQLNHINVWLLREEHGWALVDTGLFTKTTRAIWHKVLEEDLDGLPISRIIVTHLHPDHAGCAGWLASKFDIELWMTRAEYLLCRILVADTGKPAPPAGTRFYRAAGFSPAAMERYTEHFGGFGRVVSPLPDSYHRLEDGMALTIGDYEWQIIIGRGHSPEHACLVCPELNIMIAGDQLLPTISSNISVWPTEPAANPLRDWFESISMLESRLDADILVLPAHGRPFTGAHIRLAQLRQDGLPASDLPRDKLPETLTQLLTDAGMAPSGKQVKDALGRSAVTINGRAMGREQNADVAGCFDPAEALYGRFFVVRLGKKKYHLFESC